MGGAATQVYLRMMPIAELANYTLTPAAVGPGVVGVLTLGLGIAVLIREHSSFVSRAFFGMTGVGACWLLSYVGLYSSHDPSLATLWAKIENAGVVLIPSAVNLFTLAVTAQYRRLRFLAWGALFISSLFLLGILFTDRFIAGVYHYSWGYFARYGPWTAPFLVFFFSLILFNLHLYRRQYRRAVTQTEKERLRSLTTALAIAYLGSVDYLPAYGIPFFPIGYLPVFAFLVMVAQTIWRYHLVEITPAFAAERIITTLANALVVVDREGIVRVVNEAACRLFGRSEAELGGRPLAAVAPGILGKDPIEALAQTTGAVQRYETTLSGPAAKSTTLDVCASAIPDRDGRSVGTIFIAADVTDRKQAQDQLLRAHAQLKKSHEELKLTQLQLIQAAKMESVGRLAAGVAHEVKNPLAVILQGLAYLSKALGPSEDGNVTLVLDYAKGAVRRADTVIRGLLDFSVQRELEMVSEDLNAVVEQAILLVKYELERSRIRLVKQLDPYLPQMPLDKNKMEQVFVNLFVNAIHAMPEGGTLTVRTSTKALSSEEWAVAVEVEDTGTGIPEEILPKIFDPFFTTKPTGKGTGLGLTVTKNIIQMHGGTIDIQNRPEGKGVKATVTLKAMEKVPHG